MSKGAAPAPSVRVGVAGLGYMGLATALGFAARGHRVLGYDSNPAIRAQLSRATTPFHEPRLQQVLERVTNRGRFQVVETLPETLRSTGGLFVCLPTPARPSGRIDLRPITQGIRQIARSLKDVDGYRVVVIKSTVVPGTTQSVLEPLLRRLSGRGPDLLGVASNPEFLAEGSMIQDTLHPDRIVLGASDRRSMGWLRKVYAPFSAPLVSLTPNGAELVKYASNAFLALKVSFANEVSRLAERLGVNIDPVLEAAGQDPRIGRRFLNAGPGFGGSCFEKDVKALVTRARDLGVRFRLGESTLRVNAEQTEHALKLMERAAGGLRDRVVAVLGLSFKPGTDDVRESRAFPLVAGLLREGAQARVHDPVALDRFRREWEKSHTNGSRSGGSLVYSRTIPEALDRADLAVLQADWPVYQRWPKAWTARMAKGVLLDLRRSVSPEVAHQAHLRLLALGVGDEPFRGAPVGGGASA